MLGQTLNNRYAINAQLGKGAMGVVYAATDKTTHQKVALKVISQDLALESEMLARFKREGEALRQLRHRNIVAFVDMFERKGQFVIVMEYVAGGDLHALLRQGPLDAWRAAQIALDLCDALASAHRLDIIHRDIKPENVLLAEDGTPKLTDFGVARLLSAGTRLTGTGTQVGTPYYMSPEAWEGQALDAQADVWSLGVVLFEMLSGKVPFAGDTIVAVMNQVLTSPLPDLSQLRADIPPELVKVVRRALTRDKAQRYATIRQMGTDVEQVLLASKTAAGPVADGASAAQTVLPTVLKPAPPAAPTRARPTPPPAVPATSAASLASPTVERFTPARAPAKSGLPRWAWVAGGLGLALVLCALAVGGGALALKLTARPTLGTSQQAPTPLAPGDR